MTGVIDVAGWLLDKIVELPSDEVGKLITVLWGVWFWRNNKVWNNKLVAASVAMAESCRSIDNWREARKKLQVQKPSRAVNIDSRWTPPEAGALKVNVDVSIREGAESFGIGMVLRDHEGVFMAGKTLCLQAPSSVFEGEAIGVREALSWIADQHLEDRRVYVESDSQLTVRAIHNEDVNYLEVGVVVESCYQKLQQLEHVSLSFIRRNANRVAHELARYPCLAYCQVLFTSPPGNVVEAIMYDVLK